MRRRGEPESKLKWIGVAVLQAIGPAQAKVWRCGAARLEGGLEEARRDKGGRLWGP